MPDKIARAMPSQLRLERRMMLRWSRLNPDDLICVDPSYTFVYPD